MKHTKRIVAVTALLLTVVGESEGQSAYERARLEAHRWEMHAAGDAVKEARLALDFARRHRANVEPAVKKARNKVTQEKAKAERGNRDPDDLDKAEAKLFDAEKHFSITEARVVTAQSHLSVAEARIVSAEAVVVAAEAASEEALSTALAAHLAVLEAYLTTLKELINAITIDEGNPPSSGLRSAVRKHSGGIGSINYNPSASQATTVWESAARAARAARACRGNCGGVE